MENLTILHQMNLAELSCLERQEIQGGQDTVITYLDNKGYTWYYTYNESGALTEVSVARSSCIL